MPLDTTKAVTAGIHEIVLTLVEALALVVLVVFIFLQGWRATLIPLLAVPVSLIGTFIIFPALGFSINTLSLFGLVLAIGLVVDDAIIVVEAVEHHIEEGMDPEGGDRKSHGRSGRSGGGHCADSRCGVHPDGVHSRYYRPAVSTVRGNNCHLRADLGVQRTHTFSGACIAASQTQRQRSEERSARQGVRLVQQIFWPHHRELRAHLRRA